VGKGSDMPAVTLMSTDVDRMALSLSAFPQLWAQVASIAIGIWLLYDQMGPVSLAPTFLIFLCAMVQSRVANLAPKLQTKWVAAVQRRIGITSAALRSIKSIKLGGMVEVMKTVIQGERLRELQEGVGFRINITMQNAVGKVNAISRCSSNSTIGNLPDWFAGFLVFAVFAIQASRGSAPPLTTARAFTSLALIDLVSFPSAMILQLLPAVVQSLGCVKRVGDYLRVQSQSEWRIILNNATDNDASTDALEGKAVDDDLAISVSELLLGISTDDLSKVNPISFGCKKGTISMITGPVGCGKSTLLRALLGVDRPEHGEIRLRSLRTAYCTQDAWLRNCTIRENIIGPEIFDKPRYDEVLHICALDEDLSQLLLKDLTVVGAGGLVLSGGQKHRIVRYLFDRFIF
jgi:ATP-binding cassette subfamily C (CFTR/MRP) protein 1